MIRQTSPGKIQGKAVKYRLGDCLSVQTGVSEYLGVLMSGKFNKYYNLTLLEFKLNRKPTIEDFKSGKFFGTRFGTWEDLKYAVDQQMVEVKYIDGNSHFEKIGSFELSEEVLSAGYAYLKNIDEIQKYFELQLPIRITKTKNAEQFPDLAFVGKHLIQFEKIIKK